VLGVCAGALWGESVGLLAALHAGSAIRVQGDGGGLYQFQRLAQALRQDLHAQFGAQLLFDLRYGLLPALASRAQAGGSGFVAVKLGDKFVEVLAGGGGLCYTGHRNFSLRGGFRGGLRRNFSRVSLQVLSFYLLKIIRYCIVVFNINLYIYGCYLNNQYFVT
jgi:hypothetical protein